jgi:hypothetical protein
MPTRSVEELEQKAPPTNGHVEEEEEEDERDRTEAEPLNRPGDREKMSGAVSSFWNSTKEYANTAAEKVEDGMRAVQDTDPEKVASKTSQTVERGTAEVANLTKSVVTNTTAFGASIAIGFTRGAPVGLSDSQLKKLRLRDGNGELVEVGKRIHTEQYEEDSVPKKRVYIEFDGDHLDLCEGVRHEDSELPENMACVPLAQAYETAARDGDTDIEVYALPLNNEDGNVEGFLAVDREHAEVYVYTDA